MDIIGFSHCRSMSKQVPSHLAFGSGEMEDEADIIAITRMAVPSVVDRAGFKVCGFYFLFWW